MKTYQNSGLGQLTRGRRGFLDEKSRVEKRDDEWEEVRKVLVGEEAHGGTDCLAHFVDQLSFAFSEFAATQSLEHGNRLAEQLNNRRLFLCSRWLSCVIVCIFRFQTGEEDGKYVDLECVSPLTGRRVDSGFRDVLLTQDLSDYSLEENRVVD